MATSGKRARAATEAKEAEGTALPAAIGPQLATRVARVPSSGTWSYEIKFDGYRFMARVEGDDVRLFTKKQHDWTGRLPEQAQAVRELGLQDGWLDGEMVALNEKGLPDFGALQDAMAKRKVSGVIYFIFDIPFLNGRDLRGVPVEERRAILAKLLESSDNEALRFSADFPHSGEDVLANACAMGLEGIVGKRAGSLYTSDRSPDWIKLKCWERQEFVLGGYTATRGGVRSLLLGLYREDGRLVFAGSVAMAGKGRHRLADEKVILEQRASTSPFDRPPKPEAGFACRWLHPVLVAEVSFLEWTRGDVIRQGTYLGLRTDKAAGDVTKEVPQPVEEEPSDTGASALTTSSARMKVVAVENIKVTNPERVIDASTGFTKLDVIRYYAAVAQWMMPHLKRRPVSLVRAPSGISGELFFQKHAEGMTFPAMNLLPVEMYPGHAALLNVNTGPALVGAAQMGTLEFHTWNASEPDLVHPDRVIFDLDPDTKLPWEQVVEAAKMVKVVLDTLGLHSWVKTSGGKGLHVVVPLEPKKDWDDVKAFSQALARHLVKVVPGRFSAVSGARNRVGKVFVDYLRNGRAQSTVAAFSVRARPGLGVSMPVSWEELERLEASDQYNLRTALSRLERLADDPWRGYWSTAQSVTDEMVEMLGMKPET
jgi:bifunctional non-homologous end joining protein LigD